MYVCVFLLTNLECRAEFDHEGCLLIPNDNKAILCFNDEIQTHCVDLIRYFFPIGLLDYSDIFIFETNFTVLLKIKRLLRIVKTNLSL